MLRHVDSPQIYARAGRVFHGLHGKDQSLDEARRQNHLCSGNLRLLL